MRYSIKLFLLSLAAICATTAQAKFTNFPDGSEVPEWFNDTRSVDVGNLGKKYVITDYGVSCVSTIIQTEQIQSAHQIFYLKNLVLNFLKFVFLK